ncbi:hypothetical protein FHW88_004995 [Mucilaginibacter sp. SG538B]|uniref:hypothetical protein n=1 Tax=Mucilaginibacter sp. SG538B TaxID=2587021 RepID=UPI00159E16A8|nr:hypothetical protein [Mucilaginibacter sp. SG538B]NVM66677.1 hypothetical protein [Mucilaginibacter sp. SG538B]
MKLPDDDELLKTPKEELERIKLALEISSYEEDRRTARRKSWGETVRLVIMAVFAAALSLGSTYLMKTYDHATAQSDNARSRLAQLRGEYASNHILRKKDSIACLMGSVEVPDQNRRLQAAVDSFQRICDQTQTLNYDIYKNQKTIRQADKHYDQNDPQARAVTRKLDDDDAKLIRLQAQLNNKSASVQQQAQQQIEQVTKASTAAAPPDLRPAVQSSADISSSVTDQAAVTTNKTTASGIKTYPIFWVKKGYYILFDQFKVALSDLKSDAGIAQVNVCYQMGSTCNPVSVPDEGRFSLQKTLDFEYDGKSYSLVLQRIDHAGVNPFKLAAYINLVQKEK